MTTTEQSYEVTAQLREKLRKYQHVSTFIGLVFLALLVAGYFIDGPQQFLRSYLVGFYFWFGMSMGCLLLLMTQYLTGGAWGTVIRRPLEAGTKPLYVMFWGFLPLLIGVHVLYWWSTPAGAADKMIQGKHLYLNIPFLWVRWAIYGVVWLGLTYQLNKWSVLEDETKSTRYSTRLEALSGPGMVAYFFTITFASVDYLMTLEPHWFSTVYGFMIAMGQGLSAMSFVVAILVMLAKYPPVNRAVSPSHLHDLGKLMLALVMLWAYMNFAQLLITWSGNLPDEVVWYIKRWNGGWGWVALSLLLLHFCLPFALLLSQDLKRNPRTIFAIAIFIVVIRAVDVFSLVEPNFADVNNVHFSISWLDIAAPLGFGGLWLALFFWYLPQRPLMPLGAPDLQKALNHGREH
jgi:hypothetical protein